MSHTRLKQSYLLILPGLLMAMTGIGVGDLATAGFTGAQLGTSVLWAVIVGGVFKFFLTEGVARWQLASGTSLVQGAIAHFKIPLLIFMLVYFVPWCWFVGGALINASGVALKEVMGLLDIEITKAQGGVAQSLLVLALLVAGQQALFNRIMSALAILLFITVMTCVFLLPLDLGEIAKGMLVPTIPDESGAFSWTIALMGGVGGTLTVICYGYWLASSDRKGMEGLKTSRLDIALSYGFTCLFGMAMVIIGSIAVQEGKGLSLLLSISEYFTQHVHPIMGICFILGAWAAIFSSLLGVWQAVPMIFADVVEGIKGNGTAINDLKRTRAYVFWLCVLAVVPMLALTMSFKEIQKLYSVVGALFMPILAVTLIWLNTRHVSNSLKNNHWVNLALVVICAFFLGSAVYKWWA